MQALMSLTLSGSSGQSPVSAGFSASGLGCGLHVHTHPSQWRALKPLCTSVVHPAFYACAVALTWRALELLAGLCIFLA